MKDGDYKPEDDKEAKAKTQNKSQKNTKDGEESD